MLRALCAFLAIITVVLGVYVWQLSGETTVLREQLSVAKQETTNAQKAAINARTDADAARESQGKEATAATEQNGGSGALSAIAGGPPKKKSDDAGSMSAMAKMFQTEEGKKMMKTQIGMMTKMQYGDLARALNLPPEQTEKIMNLLSERANAMAGNPWKFMSEGKLDEATIKKMGEETEATRKNYDSMLKNELGDEGFQHFEEYEKSIGERMALAQLDPQFSAAGTPLQADQRDKLLQIMSDERKNSPPSEFDRTGRDAAKNMSLMNDDAAVDRWMQQEEDYRKRVVDQAGKAGVLSADQLKAFQQGFDQLAQMQKFGIKMGKEMMKAGGPQPVGGAPK